MFEPWDPSAAWSQPASGGPQTPQKPGGSLRIAGILRRVEAIAPMRPPLDEVGLDSAEYSSDTEYLLGILDITSIGNPSGRMKASETRALRKRRASSPLCARCGIALGHATSGAKFPGLRTTARQFKYVSRGCRLCKFFQACFDRDFHGSPSRIEFNSCELVLLESTFSSSRFPEYWGNFAAPVRFGFWTSDDGLLAASFS